MHSSGDNAMGGEASRDGQNPNLPPPQQNKQQEDLDQKLPAKENQQPHGEVSCPSARQFYQALHKRVQALEIDLALDETLQLPEWPHDRKLTQDLQELWQEAKSLLRSKQEFQGKKNKDSAAKISEQKGTERKACSYDDLTDRVKAYISQAEFDALPKKQQQMHLLAADENKALANENEALVELAKRSDEIRMRQTDIKSRSHDISLQTERVSRSLLNLCAHSQEQLVGTVTSDENEAKRRRIEAMQNPYIAEENCKFQTDEGSPEEDFYDEKNVLTLEGAFSQDAIFQMRVPDQLNRIANAYNGVFTENKGFLLSPKSAKAHGTGRRKNDKQYKNEITRSIEIMKRELNGNATTVTRRVRRLFPNGQALLPGPRSQEVEGAQPILAWVMDNIVAVLRTEDDDKSKINAEEEKRHSPSKSTRGDEALVLDFKDGRPFRYGDCAFTKEGCSLKMYPPDCVPIIMEIKPHFRPGADHAKVSQGGIQQEVAHLSKYLSVCLNWSGPGVDSFGTGLFGTLAYVRIVKMELVQVGTAECEVRLYKSRCFPLLSRANFDEWVASNGPTGSTDEMHETLRSELYPEDYQEGQIPFGFKAIYCLLSLKSEDLFGSLWRDDNKHSNSLGSLLGSGTFSYVFAGQDMKTAIKISRLGRNRGLKREVQALKELDSSEPGMNGRSNLPLLVRYGLHNVNVGSFNRQLEFIELSPLAQPLAVGGFCGRRDAANELLTKLFMLALDMGEALDFAHSKKISHNDLSESNIMLIPATEHSYRGVLFDFSVATFLYNELIHGSIGTPNTAHRDDHENRRRYASDFHDFGSLGFVLADLCRDKNQNRWNGGMGSFASERGAEYRLKSAMEILKSFCQSCNKNNAPVSEHLASRYHTIIKKLDGEKKKNLRMVEMFETLVDLYLQQDKKTVFRDFCGCPKGDCGKKSCQKCRKAGLPCSLLCNCGEHCKNRKPSEAASLGHDVTF